MLGRQNMQILIYVRCVFVCHRISLLEEVFRVCPHLRLKILEAVTQVRQLISQRHILGVGLGRSQTPASPLLTPCVDNAVLFLVRARRRSSG